ncbi:hypothetical protein [Pannonibacter carbonis]|jgi:hypothetical protein|uniref:hypothetical protein n=1 Tax=Pannonibacter carbonis TaxID=2067569 RepID=UPI000D113C00|nr:hypothetical protein [Pannonibacter carbonis]
MSRSKQFTNDLASLWFQAPLVIAMRTQAMMLAAATGSTRENAEMGRMIGEKAAAMVEGTLAAQQAMALQATRAMTQVALGRKPAALKPEPIAHAAVKPFAKRVRANTRRLTKT